MRYRIRAKRASPEGVDDMEIFSDDAATPATSSKGPRRGPRPPTDSTSFTQAVPWQKQVPEAAWVVEESAYWNTEQAAVAVEVEMPGSEKQWDKALHNLSGYFVGALRRQAAEVSERRLTEAERLQFRENKMTEVRNFVAAQAFEALPPHLKPSADQAISMRWILTWKVKEDGSRKAKARAVLLGYQDPQYEHRGTTAPVLTKLTRQMLLQAAANHKWSVFKGDVSGAFLQGRDYPDTLYCIPTDEICTALGLKPGSITRLRRACYGLVDAPLEWYRTVADFLQSLGLERLWSDACAWAYRKDGTLQGLISGHVDDFLFTGNTQDARWNWIIDQIKTRFKWGDWDCDHFTQCGVNIDKTEDGFILSQEKYVEGIGFIPLSSSRRREPDAETTSREKTQLRALLGALSWHGQQVAPHVSAEVGILLSDVNSSTVRTLIQANELLQYAQSRKDHKMLIHAFPSNLPLGMFCWVDAASQNRRDGGSTQGVLVGLAPLEMMKGAVGKVTPVIWQSHKIDRVCRSPGTAETQAAVNGEDELFLARFQWSEINFGAIDVKDPNSAVLKVPGCVITDSRNVYDKLQTEVMTLKGAEKRANIELLGLKEAQLRSQVQIRWVHSEAQLSNSLTKARGNHELELFYKMGHQWRIVEDDRMRSSRRRKQDGVAPLQQQPSTSSRASD